MRHQPLNYPYCSLDPLPEHTRALQEFFAGARGSGSPGGTGDYLERVKAAAGPQNVVIRGVPRDSRHAHVMVDADYHMKKVCQGHVVLPGVTSHLDRFLDSTGPGKRPGADPRGSTVSMARFWFQVGSDCPTFQESKGAVWIARCRVVVRTEKQQATPSGELYDAADDDPLAVAFADDLSKAFDSVTETVPVYAELDDLYRLRALLLAMRVRGALSLIGLDWDSYLREYPFQEERPMEPTLPCLANWKCRAERRRGMRRRRDGHEGRRRQLQRRRPEGPLRVSASPARCQAVEGLAVVDRQAAAAHQTDNVRHGAGRMAFYGP